MSKKIVLVLAIALLVGGVYGAISVIKAEPVKDYDKVSPTVRIESYRLSRGGSLFKATQASATLISPDGLLLTNSHVVLDDDKEPYDAFAICLTFDKNQEPVCEYTASLKAYDRGLDLALLKLNAEDNRGGVLPAVNYLPYDFSETLVIGNGIDIFGYPDNGGKTLTQTRGQLAGYELKNEVNYLKTDADISSGNSGGTALNEKGQFVGVPTFVVSSVENLGYVLDIKQAVDFINSNLANQSNVNNEALVKLKTKLNIFNNAKDSKSYYHPGYPSFQMALSAGWEWDEIENNYISLISKSNKGNKNIEINIYNEPYAINDDYLAEVMRVINLYTEYLTDYKEEKVNFAGVPATLITFNSGEDKNFQYLIAYGNSLITVKYSIALDSYVEDKEDFESVLKSFAFIGKPNDNLEVMDTLTNLNPAFSISSVNGWSLQKSQQQFNEELIATLGNPALLKGEINIYYRHLDESLRDLSNEEIFQKMLLLFQQSSSKKLINKDSGMVLDGLKGWSLTYTEPGQENQTVDKISEVYLRDGDYYYEIAYSSISDKYTLYLDDFKSILRTFKNHNQPKDQIGKNQYQLGVFDYAYIDISFHRFEQAITKLADKGIVYGYTDNSFRPEKLIMTAELRQFVKNALKDTKRPNTNELFLNSLPEGEVTLAQAAEVFGRVFNLDIWQNSRFDAPLWKPYMDKAWQMSIVPSGLIDPQAKLTRAEFVYMLNELLSNFE